MKRLTTVALPLHIAHHWLDNAPVNGQLNVAGPARCIFQEQGPTDEHYGAENPWKIFKCGPTSLLKWKGGTAPQTKAKKTPKKLA